MKVVKKENDRILLDTMVNQINLHLDRHGLVGTILKVYSRHYHLVPRPDDVWLGITNVFGKYVDRNAEEMSDVTLFNMKVKRISPSLE